MVSKIFRDVGGGRRRGNAGFNALAWCALLMLVVLPGCETSTPTSPNNSAALTGQTTNSQFVFSGSLQVSQSSGTLPADDTSSVVIQVNVTDQSGNPIPNLTNVGFSTDLGAFNISGSLFTDAQVTTFNGIAQIVFQSFGRQTGVATITAFIGNVARSTQVTLEPAPVSGTLQVAFGSSGSGGTTTMTGAASAAVPFDVSIAAIAVDGEGQPIAGANVSFRIDEDTTSDNTTNPSAEFTVSRHTITGTDGNAVTVLRAQGPGTVVVEAEMSDPNTGALVAVSNRVILTTTQATGGATLRLAFGTSGAGPTTLTGVASPVLPFDTNIGVTATTATGAPIVGGTVTFRIVKDTTNATGTPSAKIIGNNTATTSATGNASVVLRASGPGDVVLQADVTDPTNGQVLTSNQIVLTTQTQFLVAMTFSDGISTTFTAAAPYTEPIIVTVTDAAGNPQAGVTVRLTITSDDSTAGASLGTALGTTGPTGVLNSSVTVPDDGGTTSSVQILAEVLDASGAVLSTSNVVVAIGT